MGVKYLMYLITIYYIFAIFAKGQDIDQGALNSGVDITRNNKNKVINGNNHQDFNKPLEILNKNINSEENEYLLPPVLNRDEGLEEDEEHETSYLDYDYDLKETNYKDSPDSSTIRTNLNIHGLGDQLPIHTAKDNLPIFLIEPENTYVVKNKPATLKCRAANALEIYFKCIGIKVPAPNFELVDPQTGVRIVEAEHKVTRENVEEYFGSDKYQCACFAWTSRGHIKSQSASVEIAYIKKHFAVAPDSKLVKQYSPVTFRCEPPPAAPFAQLYWLKNGAPLIADDNVQITKEGSLVIKQASVLDMANYTCIAENLAGKRISDPGTLTVFVNGGWTAWSIWGECWCDGQSRESREGYIGRRRVRSCTAPRPLNGGQPCVGPSVQKTQDCLDCDLDLYVDALDELADQSSGITSVGRWSQWSEWSRCDSDCLQSRRRRCLSSGSCLGKDYQVAQCPLCVRTSKSNILNGSSYWTVLLAMSITFIILIVIIILGVKYMKTKMIENSPYVKPPPELNYFGNVIKRTLNNQPDLIHEEFQTIDSKHTHRQAGVSSNKQNEHFYEVPQLTSYIAPIDYEVKNDRSRSPRNYGCKENVEIEKSDSSYFLSSDSSCANESIEMSPSLRNNASIDSNFLNSNNLVVTTSQIVTSEGGLLNLDKCGVSLYIPEGVVDKGEVLFSIEVTDDGWNRPVLQEGETFLSPVIRCCPKNNHFSKGVVICFPHWASLKNTSWILSILQNPEDINSREWRKVLTLGQEMPGMPIFAQVDPGKVYLMCEFLSDFILVGKSLSGLDVKLLKVCLFISRRLENDNFSLNVHVFNDTPYGLYDCLEIEKTYNSSLLCEPKTLLFQENCSDICINLSDLGIGWKVQTGVKYQELSYNNVWNMTIKSLRCNFIIQQTDSINNLELNIAIYQKQKQSNSVNFNLKASDFNFNYSERFSSVSGETGCSVNILENPFNYSSLSRKVRWYDYKFDNSYRNEGNDANYRINTLTKSDRIILCKLLDSQVGKGNDWRLLGEKLKLSSYYYYFSNTCSPTENILNLWLCRNNDATMLVTLSRIFREMSRIDCATVVERRCFTN